jgi:hypothetical protein
MIDRDYKFLGKPKNDISIADPENVSKAVFL